jgi:transcriptional regulator with XRE-family HTH domain
MDAKLKIGHRIKELRLGMKISQEQLALRAEIDRTYMTGVENGKRNVSIMLIDRIIKALDTTYEEFFEGYEKNEKE